MSDFQLINDFADLHSRAFKNIREAVSLTDENCRKIVETFNPYIPLLSSDADLVVFGSLARNECTLGSDVDWTLLVDGQVSEQHYQSSIIIKKALSDLRLVPPGLSGMFGQITFSHDLVHYIGGEDDTNHNITRRILLLLESDKLLVNSETDVFGTAYERVQKAIINEYIKHDSGFSSVSPKNAKVPRFLLNDIIRFWRTMCVDFAYKQKEQDGTKWGLRNIKLRMSRKMIYFKGLLMCYSCYNNEEVNRENIAQHLSELTLLKPLDVILKVLSTSKIDNLLLEIFDSYDEFLGILNAEEIRKILTELRMKDAYKDETFLKVREVANRFQATLSKIFESTDDLTEFTRHYMVF